MDGAEHEIEPAPASLHPLATGIGMNRVVIQLNSGSDFQIRIGFAETLDFVEVNAFMIAIMIGEGKVAQTDFARMIGPGLQQPRRVRLKPVTLWVKMIVGKEAHVGWDTGYETLGCEIRAA
jgi:hypothetical protein